VGAGRTKRGTVDGDATTGTVEGVYTERGGGGAVSAWVRVHLGITLFCVMKSISSSESGSHIEGIAAMGDNTIHCVCQVPPPTQLTIWYGRWIL
jgi:hypothetical protein